jgi:hypothetical protein
MRCDVLCDHPIGSLPAPHQAGVASTLECFEGRDELGRAPPVSVAEGIWQMVQAHKGMDCHVGYAMRNDMKY